MAVPTRVTRTGSPNTFWYWDGVNPMTELANGWGSILSGIGVGSVTLSGADFDVMQAELVGRLIGFGGVEGSGLALNEDYLQAVADAVHPP